MWGRHHDTGLAYDRHRPHSFVKNCVDSVESVIDTALERDIIRPFTFLRSLVFLLISYDEPVHSSPSQVRDPILISLLLQCVLVILGHSLSISPRCPNSL